jgi:hypothetical protein
MRLNALILLFVVFSCHPKSEGSPTNCFPASEVSEIKILVADTTIMGDVSFEKSDSRFVYISGGVGFVDSMGRTTHPPIQKVALSNSQRDKFLNLLRPIVLKEGDILSESACTPIFRHAALFTIPKRN